MEKRRINGVFFDLGWTLERPADDDWVLTRCFFEYVSREAYYAMDEALRTKAIRHAMEPLETNHHIVTMEEENVRFTEFYTDLSRYLSLGLSEEVIRTIATDHTYNFSNYVVFDSTAKTLETLKNHGYKVGVISDTWPSTVPQQKEAGLWDYYDCTTLSCFLGVLKPHPRMYEDALEKMGLPAEETVYIDDLTMSLDAAKAYGIHGVCSIARPGMKVTPDYPCIHQPEGLLEVLKAMNGGIL
ncbi:MAG: HAD-IA family hydrolase [Solobacterium sp.]|nr:HAD-IA family hydrolase [Solobacterium sp.]